MTGIEVGVAVIIGVLLGAAAGAAVLWRLLPGRLRQHVDYKQRWEDAIGLLGAQGQLTEEQVSQITAPRAAPEPAEVRQYQRAGSHSVNLQAGRDISRTLRNMASWDRKEVEITRARKGLPPVDDLVGMASWDQKAVLEARAKAGTG